jgi:hypothetical protein
MTESAPVPPVQTTVVGIGTASPQFLPTGTVATTPGAAQPNIIINVVGPLIALTSRFLNLFGVTFLGLITAAYSPAGGKLLYTGDFFHMVVTCANLSLPVATLGLVKNLVTIFAQLEQKYPLLTGKV